MTDEPEQEQPAEPGEAEPGPEAAEPTSEPTSEPDPQPTEPGKVTTLMYAGPHDLPVGTQVKLMERPDAPSKVVLVAETPLGSIWLPLEDQVAEGTAANLLEALRRKRENAAANLAIARTMPPAGQLDRLMPGGLNRAARRRGRR